MNEGTCGLEASSGLLPCQLSGEMRVLLEHCFGVLREIMPLIFELGECVYHNYSSAPGLHVRKCVHLGQIVNTSMTLLEF